MDSRTPTNYALMKSEWKRIIGHTTQDKQSRVCILTSRNVISKCFDIILVSRPQEEQHLA